MVVLTLYLSFYWVTLFTWRTSLGVRDHVSFTGRGNGHGLGSISEPALLNVYRLIPPTNTHPT